MQPSYPALIWGTLRRERLTDVERFIGNNGILDDGVSRAESKSCSAEPLWHKIANIIKIDVPSATVSYPIIN
jgi:hypothetical protein